MNPLLFIVGPTATGKTKLALEIAARYPAEIISADSRQVYREMDIGTGKDVPPGAVRQEVRIADCQVTKYQVPHTNLWLIDQVEPNQEWSVSQFSSLATAVIRLAWAKQTLPVVVGGTGLYTRTLTEPFATLHIPQNPKLRAALEHTSTPELQEQLKKVDARRFSSMNTSDQQNPRRLLRAIEVAHFPRANTEHIEAETLWIGLNLPFPDLQQRIRARVEKRLAQGMEQEVQRLMHAFPDWSLPAFSALGYRETRAYLEGAISKPQLIETWTTKELQYAKRQMVWYAKQPQIAWFRAQDAVEKKRIEKCVQDWYDRTHAAH